MSHWDAIGYAAASMVFVAFGMKDMIPLRIVAMLSNLAFVVYRLGLHLAPVWLLHAVLLPLNGWRLAQAVRCSPSIRAGSGIARRVESGHDPSSG
jgi:CRP/FNR family transcriptional regulator, cyclic AMP receptor protein